MKNSNIDVIPSSPKPYQGEIAKRGSASAGEVWLRLVLSYKTHSFRATSVKTVCVAAGLTERYFYETFAYGAASICKTCTVIGKRVDALGFHLACRCDDAPYKLRP